MNTWPSFSMSILTPVSAMILLMIFAAGSDHVFDLVGVDRHTIMRGAYCDSSRCARPAIVSLSLLMMNSRDFFASTIASRMIVDRDSVDLDVHLDRRDPVDRSGDLEVHLAERVFEALDVGEDRVLLAVRTRPIATPATCF